MVAGAGLMAGERAEIVVNSNLRHMVCMALQLSTFEMKSSTRQLFFKGVCPMSGLSACLPGYKLDRLRNMARTRGTTINRLIDEMTTLMLAEFDAETRFLLHAGCGHGKTARGFALFKNAAA